MRVFVDTAETREQERDSCPPYACEDGRRDICGGAGIVLVARSVFADERAKIQQNEKQK